MPTPPYEGGCFCGAVRYRLTDDPLWLHACHCTDCQRFTGSSFALSMVVSGHAFERLRGDPRRYVLTLPDGREKSGRFCETCGSRLWGEPTKFPQLVVVRAGTLDDTTYLDPVGHIWTRSAQPWVRIPEGVLVFAGEPDPGMLFEAWQARRRR